MKAVLDTNIFVSGIHWKGISSKIIEAMHENKFKSVTSEEILKEFVGIMQNFKIQMPNEAVMSWKNLIMCKSEIVLPKQKLNVVKNDPDDNKFIEAAIEGNCDYIVSKDKKHLLIMKEFKGIKIVSPEEFLGLISKN